MVLDYCTQTVVSVCIDHQTGHYIHIAHAQIKAIKDSYKLGRLGRCGPPPPPVVLLNQYGRRPHTVGKGKRRELLIIHYRTILHSLWLGWQFWRNKTPPGQCLSFLYITVLETRLWNIRFACDPPYKFRNYSCRYAEVTCCYLSPNHIFSS